MKRSFSYFAVLAFVTLGGPVAQGDDDERRGIRAGPFLVAPSVTLEQGYDTNILLSASTPKESYTVTAAPRVRVLSDWNRHALELEAGVTAGFLTHHNDDSFVDFDVALSGELDISRAARVSARAFFQRGHERRGSIDVPGFAAEPVIFRHTGFEVRGDFAFNAFRVSPFATIDLQGYDDVPLIGGGVSNQDDRDRLAFGGGVELGYRVSRGLEGFVRLAYGRTDYSAVRDDTGVNRDSQDVTVDSGVRVRLTRLLEGRAGIGMTHRWSTDPSLSDLTTAFADIVLVWDPSPRLSLELDLHREIRDTTLPGAAGVATINGTLTLRYDIRRTVTLNTSVRAAHLDFDGTQRKDRLFGATMSADWALTRRISLSGGYAIDLRSSSAVGLRYTAHRVFLNTSYKF